MRLLSSKLISYWECRFFLAFTLVLSHSRLLTLGGFFKFALLIAFGFDAFCPRTSIDLG